ncbi:unnamed protein product [Cuscuta campestris]|uniref:Uncharacterized protein n=1 Tax=Cuscuta campestris TaxID=132261 RepID=A0A484LMM0_9ASTE|nr:unnamed protein product [Cuscuta campestris]
MLENQIASQASTSQSKATGKLPAHSENPKDHVNAIITRSGKQTKDPQPASYPDASKEDDILEEVEEIPREATRKDPKSKKGLQQFTPPLPFPQRVRKSNEENEVEECEAISPQEVLSVTWNDLNRSKDPEIEDMVKM